MSIPFKKLVANEYNEVYILDRSELATIFYRDTSPKEV